MNNNNYKCPLYKFEFNEANLAKCEICEFYQRDSDKILTLENYCGLALFRKQVEDLRRVYFSNEWVDKSEKGFLEYLSKNKFFE